MDWFGINAGANLRFNSVGDIISALIGPIFVLGGMTALLFLIWGGIRYMTARGDPKNLDSARGTITSAVIGLLIVILSAAIFLIFGEAFGISIFSKILSPTPAYAVSIGGTVQLGTGTINQFSSFGELFTNVVLVGLTVGAVIFFGMIVLGGLRFLSSGGDPKSAEAARGTITNAVIGLLIVVVSIVIIEVIIRTFGEDNINTIFG